MSTIRINTSFNIDIDFDAPPFHQRLFAWIIDVIILIFYCIAALWLARNLLSNTYDENSNTRAYAVFFLMIVPLFTYHLFCEILMNGQSVGKRLLGIRVVNEKGSKPSISQFIIRWLIRTSDYMAVVFIFIAGEAIRSEGPAAVIQLGVAFGLLILDVILVNSSKKHQRLGDMLAHTILIKTKQKTSIDETIFQEVSDKYVPSFPDVMRLSDRDINALKNILDTAKKHHDFDLAANASEKIKTHLNIQTSLSPFDFLEILLKDYNYLSAK